MYPILMRLADRGLLETVWETEPSPGWPSRHLYRLTGAGLDLAAAHAEPEPQAAATAWETEPSPGWPSRHLYRLTGAGLDLAAAHAEPEPQAAAPAPTRPRLRQA